MRTSLPHSLSRVLSLLIALAPPAFADNRTEGYGIGGAAWDTYSKTANPQDATAGGVLNTPTPTATTSPASTLNSGKGGGADFAVNTKTSTFACSSSITASNPLRTMAGGVYFRITACDPQSTSAQVNICTQALQTASTCADTTPQLLAANYPLSWNPSPSSPNTTDSDLTFQWQCTSPSSCSISVVGTLSLTRTKAQLDATSSSNSDIKQAQIDATASSEYAQSSQTAAAFSNCTSPTIDPVTGDKTWSSCPDASGKTVQIDMTSKTTSNGNPQCASQYTNECQTFSTQVNNYERTCSVSPEIVTRSQTVHTDYIVNNKQTTCTSTFHSALQAWDPDTGGGDPNKNCVLIPALPNTDQSGDVNTIWPQFVRWCGSGQEWRGTNPTANVPDSLTSLTNVCDTSIRLPQFEISKQDKIQCDPGAYNTCQGPGTDENSGQATDPLCVCSAASLVRTATYKKEEPPTVTVSITNTTFDEAPLGTCRQDIINLTENSTCQSAWVARTLPADQCSATEWNSYLGATLTRQLNETQKAGCGYCSDATVTSVCMTEKSSSSCDSASANYLAGCTLTSHVADSYLSGTTGIATSFLDTYACQQATQVCTQYKLNPNAPACLSNDMAQGADALPYQSTDGAQSFSKAMQSMAVAKEVAKEASTSDTPNLSIFAGKDLRCQRPRNSITGVLQKNCCKLGIDRPSKGNIIQGGCDQNAAELSASREKGNTHYVGEFCSSKTCFLGMCTCKEYTQTYCSFPSLLPRLVQEQGREQLNGVIASGQASAQQQSTTFPYYAGSGQWTPVFDSNGVKTAYWSWPAACQDPAVAAERALAGADQAPCSGALSVWVASCISGDKCGALPAYPEKDSSTWSMIRMDALTANTLTATSPFSTAQGTCDTSSASCTFTASHIPRNGSGKALVTQRLAWTMASADTSPSSAYYTESQYTAMCLQNFPASKCPPNAPMPESYKRVPSSASPRSFSVGPLLFRAPYGLNAANQIQWSYSYDNGLSWNNLNTPAQLSAPTTYVLAQPGLSVVMQGACNTSTLLCAYTATVASPITAKPWGSAQSPDCSGFTTTQLGVLDFDKMDLGAWTSTLATTMKPVAPPPSSIANNDTLKKLQNDQAQGTTSLSSTTSQPFVTLSPTEGFGPFTMTVKLPKVYPSASAPAADQDPVISASIDWGTCAGFAPIPWTGQLFSTSFTAPDPKYAWQGCQQGAQEKDFVHNIQVKVQLSRSAEKIFYFKVNNRWGSNTGPAPSGTAASPTVNTGTLPGR